jgi:quinol monooxygenase YgiN
MKELQITARLQIHSGKLDAFEEAAKKCLTSVREKDKGTLQYDWFLNEDRTICIVRERYEDSDAVVRHAANLGDTLEELLGVCDLSLEVCGTPSTELLEFLEGMDVSVYSPFQGTSNQ